MSGDAILIIKTGLTMESVRARRGTFELWVRQATGLSEARTPVVHVEGGDPLPDPDDYAAVVVSGSAAMLTDRADWSERTARWLAQAAQLNKSILGICYGHQLLAHGLGGEVAQNPNGRQIGTIEVALNDEGHQDPLLGDLGADPLVMQSSHSQAVVELPEGATLLAGSSLDPHQAFRIRDRIWGIQFHPEFDDDVIRGYISERADAIRDEGLDPDELLEQVRASDHGERLLRRFIEIISD